MIILYLSILAAAGLVAGLCRLLDRPSPVCWTMATGLILLVFCADLGRSLLTASPLDLGSTLGAAVLPVAMGLWLCHAGEHAGPKS